MLFNASRQRHASALVVSFVAHLLVFAILIWLGAHRRTAPAAAFTKTTLQNDIVWLDAIGRGRGGGGSGDGSIEPPRPAKLEGKDRLTVPVKKAEDMSQPNDTPEPDRVENLAIPAVTLASADMAMVGSVEGIPSADSLGKGAGGRAGSGSGKGDGSGVGDGLGPGFGGNTGGDSFRPGSGIDIPVPIASPKPEYTAQAMRAKVQGRVLLECIVEPDGTVARVRIVRSLDSIFGLDQEAIKAARSWRFRPGTRNGRPVPVLITIEMAFALR